MRSKLNNEPKNGTVDKRYGTYIGDNSLSNQRPLLQCKIGDISSSDTATPIIAAQMLVQRLCLSILVQ